MRLSLARMAPLHRRRWKLNRRLGTWTPLSSLRRVSEDNWTIEDIKTVFLARMNVCGLQADVHLRIGMDQRLYNVERFWGRTSSVDFTNFSRNEDQVKTDYEVLCRKNRFIYIYILDIYIYLHIWNFSQLYPLRRLGAVRICMKIRSWSESWGLIVPGDLWSSYFSSFLWRTINNSAGYFTPRLNSVSRYYKIS